MPQLARPVKSSCVVRMPVSMMYAVTLDAVVGYVNELLSGRSRWSMRSRPQDGGFGCVSSALTVRFCSTYATAGSLASAFASASLISAAKPCTELVYR